MKCNKCDSKSSLILRKKDHYCNECFLIGTNHKFRACIGKNKILSKNEKVLLGASCGAGSTVLLDLVHSGLSLDIHKKLRIIPCVLHIKESTSLSNDYLPKLLKLCETYNFDVHIINISDYLSKDNKLTEINSIPNENDEQNEKFQTLLNNMPSTAANDFVKKVKRSLLIQYAKLLQCNYIFTAETTTTLAIHLLSNIAIGRGEQVQNDVGFIDCCDKNVKILRPMKDISQEELDYYIKIKEIKPIKQTDIKSNSLQNVISTFVTDLQDNFQSTISTVCKTADKIGVTSNENDIILNCTICENPLSKRTLKLSALDATIFSRTVSSGVKDLGENEKLFPLIDTHLCYSCSRNYSEIKHSDSINFVQNRINDIK